MSLLYRSNAINPGMLLAFTGFAFVYGISIGCGSSKAPVAISDPSVKETVDAAPKDAPPRTSIKNPVTRTEAEDWATVQQIQVQEALKKYASKIDKAKPADKGFAVGKPSDPIFPMPTASNSAALAAVELQVYTSALDWYKTFTGTYPKTLNDFVEIPKNYKFPCSKLDFSTRAAKEAWWKRVQKGEDCWSGPWIDRAMLIDPWGSPFVYTHEGSKGLQIKLTSLGADKKVGGDKENADISIRASLEDSTP